MFYFKKILSAFLLPLPLISGFLVVGLVFLWFTRKKTTGRWLVTLGAFFLFIFGNDGVSKQLLYPLEHRFPSRVDVALSRGNSPKWIVVLSGGHLPRKKLPLSSRPGESTLVRTLEGILLHRRHPGTRLFFSGGRSGSGPSAAETMADLALALGVLPKHIRIDPVSKDTKDQAKHLSAVLGKAPFFLVTSAAHMPRAVALFQKQGTRPLPAPTGFMSTARRFRLTLPDAKALRRTEFAFHEYLGLLWARFRGQI